jgi:YVTN family beta-propeller protein
MTLHFRLPALTLVSATLLLSALPNAVPADDHDRLTVGVQKDGRIVVPTNQVLKPAGKQVTFPGRPVDLSFADHGKTLVVKCAFDLVFIDVATATIKQTLSLPRRGSPRPGFSVVGLQAVGDRIFASDAHNQLRVALRQPNSAYRFSPAIDLPKPQIGGFVHPAGITVQNSDKLWVAATRGNAIYLLNSFTGQVEQTVQVGVAPYMIRPAAPERLYVSNWGGDPPTDSQPQARSSDTPIRIDPTSGIANHGSVSVVGAVNGVWKQLKSIPVGLHPSGMVTSPSGRFLYVANANSDSVSVIDTTVDRVVETISCRPENRLPFGSGSNALALAPDGATLYAANGTINCLAVIRLGARSLEEPRGSAKGDSIIAGLIPTGWYPGAVLVSPDSKKLFVANVKGHGSLSQPRPVEKGKRSHDALGSVSVIDVPDAENLAQYTKEVHANNRLAYSLAGLETPRPGVRPVAVPARHGEPSVFRHVIYIIKENRTYDQVLGDLKQGAGDPKLVMFGSDITPNHHALVQQFTLFDNFYCSGVLSADGHSWCNEAYVTDYLEKAFGGFTRSYPDDGSDPLAYPSSGFLWDNALAHNKTFGNFGEFVNAEFAPKGTTWTDVYRDYKDGTARVPIAVKANIRSMAPFTHPRYPWFPLLAPDVYRAGVFIEELKSCEEKGVLPNLIYLTLPCDHTEGTKPSFPRPQSMVADNDLALGRIVDAVSHSKFWQKTCIFVVEDDPQDGFDHVDAHRTVALVISPYTRRQFVDHTNYNQTGMVKSIELILGLPPMNQLDLSATAMRHCFQERPDLTPYTHLPNRVALDDMNPNLKDLQGQALHWAKRSLELNFDEADKADENTLNRILWHATRGDEPFPEAYSGTKNDD